MKKILLRIYNDDSPKELNRLAKKLGFANRNQFLNHIIANYVLEEQKKEVKADIAEKDKEVRLLEEEANKKALLEHHNKGAF